MPVLEATLKQLLSGRSEAAETGRQFPFQIRGFHSDNGSEFINHTVASLLNKLLVEQTKSRPRHSNDNGMAETKNGWGIRKHIGYGHIASAHAEAFDEFYRQYFNPYLNFHRPCGVPETNTDPRSRWSGWRDAWRCPRSPETGALLPGSRQWAESGVSWVPG